MATVTDDRRTWGLLVPTPIQGRTIEIWGASDQQRQIIVETLSKIPRSHLALIPRVVVGEVVGGGRIRQGGNTITRAGAQRTELSFGCLSDLSKRVRAFSGGRIHKTILHETGHRVHWRFHLDRYPEDPKLTMDVQTWINTTTHRGVHQGPGERYADLYMHLFAPSDALPRYIRDAIARRLGIR